jgi:regulatory protein
MTKNPLREKALALLARRDYSRAALARRLASLAAALAGEDEDPVPSLEALLNELVSDGFLSDPRYAARRAQGRGERYGNAQIRNELRQDGVGAEEIAAAIEFAGEESMRCRAVWEKKFGNLPESRVAAARQRRFLCHRGFSSASIASVLGREMHEEEDDVC